MRVILLSLVGMMVGVSSINVISHRRHQTHAVEMVSSDAHVPDERHVAIQSAFCENWAPVFRRHNNGFILMKQSADADKLVDIFWLTVRQADVPGCAVRMVPIAGCPGGGNNVCVFGAVDVPALGHPHIHFSNYNIVNHQVDLRLSLKDTCLQDPKNIDPKNIKKQKIKKKNNNMVEEEKKDDDYNNYHYPQAHYSRKPDGPQNMKFNEKEMCNTEGDYKYRREVVRGWNAMFGGGI